MKLTLVIVTAAMALAGAASAQTGYVEGVAQSAFGNVTSQSFGVEGGFTVAPRLVVFGEFGRVRDTAPSEVGVAAQAIAGYLTAVQSASVSYPVRQPVTFGVAGLAYLIPYDAAIHPYVLAGFGVARYTRDVSFTVGGTDVTSTIGDYGVVLGSDLSGSTTKPMLTAGGGVAWTVQSAIRRRLSVPLRPDLCHRQGHQCQPRRDRSRHSILMGR